MARRPALRPALGLLALWTAVAIGLAAWGLASGPQSGGARPGPAGEFHLLDRAPPARIVTVRVRWDAPPGSVGWVVLEPGRPWSGPAEAYWRRRVLPGWNQLVWDDFSRFPAERPLSLRVLDGQGTWSVAPLVASSGYRALHLVPLRGLLTTIVLAALVTLALAWRRARQGGRPVGAWPLALSAVAVAALGLRLHTLSTPSFWFDEVLTAIGSQSFAWVLYSPQVFGHPPLQYLVGWAAGGGQAAEGWMRLPFVVAGVAAVVAVGLLGRRLFGPATGLVAAALLAVSPFHVELSQLARPYALLVLGAAASWLMLVRALERGTALDWIGFSVAAALSCYTHYLAGMVVVAQGVMAAAWVARRRGEGALRALVSFAAVAVLLAPSTGLLERFAHGQVGGGRVSLATIVDFARGALAYELLGAGPRAALTGGLLVLGLWRLRRRPELGLAVLAVLALPLAIVWAVNPTQPLAGRYFGFALPVVVLTVALGLVGVARGAGAACARVLGPRHPGAGRAAAVAAAVALIAAGNLPVRAALDQYYRWRAGNDWRTVAAVLDRIVEPGDEVVATLGAVYPLRYYWRDAVPEVDGSALSARPRPGPRDRRLWIVTLEGWDRAPELHAWLASHAVQVGEVAASWSLPRVFIHRARPDAGRAGQAS
jgi:hypothetical protein